MVHHLNQPGFWVSSWIKLDECKQKRFLHHVSRVFSLKTVLPCGPSYQREKILTVEVVELHGVGDSLRRLDGA